MNPSQNDSFGSFSSGQGGYIGQPGAYSAGPIMINNGGIKKSKKWAIIIILLLVILVAIGVVFLINNNKNNGVSKTELVSKWQPYYRLIVLGPDAEEEQNVEDVTDTEEWYLTEIYKNSDESDEEYIDYFQKLENLLEELSPSINNYDINSYDSLAKIFIRYSIIDVKTNELLNIYVEEGYEKALEYVDSLTDIGNSEIKFFTENYKKYLLNELDMYDYYGKKGCILNSMINYNCNNNDDDEWESVNYSDLATRYMNEMDNYAENNSLLYLFLMRTSYANEKIME